MSAVFSGTVLLPGETGMGLHASFEMGSEFVRLIAGDDVIGSWRREECDVARAGDGAFCMGLAGEEVTFMPHSPSAFAHAMVAPFAPRPSTGADGKKEQRDYDAAFAEMTAASNPARHSKEDIDVVPRPMLVALIGILALLMAGIALLPAML